MLKLAIAQTNPTVGDIAGNVAAMTEAAHRAAATGAALVAFPELSLTGYYPGDLLDDPAFLARVDAGLAALLQASCELPALHWIVGAPLPRDRMGPGKALENALVVIRDGAIVARYAKQLLPTYDVFDERRHFEPGADRACVLRIGAHRVGLMICEDGWNDAGGDYAVNPFERLAEAAPDLIVSINASPSNLHKRAQRHAVFGAACRRHELPLVFVNQVGGQDQIVFDGASFALEADGRLAFEAASFDEELRVLAFEHGLFRDADGAPLETKAREEQAPSEFYRRQIVLGLRDYARRCGFARAVVGSSGGIDSAVTLALAVEAFGPDNVDAITMPSSWSSAGSVDDSVALCRNLGVRLHVHPIADLVGAYARQYEQSFGAPLAGLALENLQARVRGTVLMEFSNAFGPLLLTTGNKSELSVGYCTLYGDTNGGLGLIGDLYKTEVFALARHLNAAAGRELIPLAIIDKPPSAELAPGQLDTDSLPPYPLLDEILKLEIEGQRLAPEERAVAQAVVAGLVAQPAGMALVAKIRAMIARSEYKRRQAPPIIRLRARAFGSGRQLPITAKLH